MQHLALKVGGDAELLAMRDRLRSKGVPVMGPVEHGMCRSIYFAGPENLSLELSYSNAPINNEEWIDPEVVALIGASPEELANMGDTVWGETFASGAALVGTPGSGSLGGLQAGALEESNVDLAHELVHMITAQRAYQANAQVITTADTLFQTIINI